MALASNLNLSAQRWSGRTGREYRSQSEGMPRRGSKATVRAVVCVGAPAGSSTPAEGEVLALKLPWKGNPEAPDAIDREGVILDVLTADVENPPCPRLYDALEEERPGQPRARITGLVMEWCPDNLETWWVAHHNEDGAFERLCDALAEVCERVVEATALVNERLPLGQLRPKARLKPRNVARSERGRWLLSDFDEVLIQSLYDEHLSATQPLLGGENYLAPEVIFGSTPHPSSAQDTWSIGCMLYALLRVRPYIHAGAALPADGTNSPHFRTHRMHLVTDLHTRKSSALAGQPLDPAQFLYADRLPDQDRRAVLQSLEGIFGERDPGRESILATDVVRVLDRALRIDPAQRYGDPAEMARDLRTLADIYRRQVALGSSDAIAEEATMLMPGPPLPPKELGRPRNLSMLRPEPTPPQPEPSVASPEPARPAPEPARPSLVEPVSSAAPMITEPTRLGDISVSAPRRSPSAPSAPPAPVAPPRPRPAPVEETERTGGAATGGLPTWVKLLLGGMLITQLALCGVIAFLLLQD